MAKSTGFNMDANFDAFNKETNKLLSYEKTSL